ncbi:MAG: LysE family translocator [Pseudomonas oryzihabitans]
MEHFTLYLLLCSLTIASPGPGVLFTIDNALSLRWRGALPGILGVVLGMLAVASLASTALGALISSSPGILLGLQWLAALYLGWLGLVRLRGSAATATPSGAPSAPDRPGRLVLQGLLVSATNPKLLVFFLALFPPFLDTRHPVLPQITLLVATFCGLSLLIHCGYAQLAAVLGRRFASGGLVATLNRTAGGIFLSFAVLLLAALPGMPWS